MKLDQTDLSIISIMLEDAKTSYAEIGKELNVSGGTVHVRLKKLSDMGVITGSKLKVDFSKLGYDVIAFVGILLEKSQYYAKTIEELKKIPEVISAHYTTGNYSIFSQILCKDTDHLREILSTRVQQIEGIHRTETFISLDESIHRPPMVIDSSNTKKEKKKRKKSSN
jgi:Transcriptional regulators